MTTALMVFCGGLVAYGVVAPGAPEPAPAFEALTPADPVRVAVPSLDIRASVVPVPVSADQVLDPPADAETVGWWGASARPGDPAGQTVITGHTVHTGGGALDRIGEVRRGAVVDVITGEGRMRYRVQRTATLERDQVADRAEALFGQDRGDGRLVLVTCTDWNGFEYARNVLIFGTPLGEPTARRT